mgnify:CR=1 FL=1
MAKVIVNQAVSLTDSQLVAGVAGKKVRVTALAIKSGGTATNVTFNSKLPSAAPVAVSPLLAMGANDDLVLPSMPGGWFDDTASGAALTCTTGAGSATGMMVHYDLVDA